MEEPAGGRGGKGMAIETGVSTETREIPARLLKNGSKHRMEERSSPNAREARTNAKSSSKKNIRNKLGARTRRHQSNIIFGEKNRNVLIK